MKTEAAILANMRRAAYRAAEDPERLARARRVVVAAILTGRLSALDLGREVEAWKGNASS